MMKPTPEAEAAMQACAEMSIKAQLLLEQALDELSRAGTDAFIAFCHTHTALKCLAELGKAQHLINAMRGKKIGVDHA